MATTATGGGAGRPPVRQRFHGAVGGGAVTAGEYLEAVVGDEDRVLELRRALAIGSDGRPVVVPHAEVPRPDADHRLDGERVIPGRIVSELRVVEWSTWMSPWNCSPMPWPTNARMMP